MSYSTVFIFLLPTFDLELGTHIIVATALDSSRSASNLPRSIALHRIFQWHSYSVFVTLELFFFYRNLCHWVNSTMYCNTPFEFDLILYSSVCVVAIPGNEISNNHFSQWICKKNEQTKNEKKKKENRSLLLHIL